MISKDEGGVVIATHGISRGTLLSLGSRLTKKGKCRSYRTKNLRSRERDAIQTGQKVK